MNIINLLTIEALFLQHFAVLLNFITVTTYLRQFKRKKVYFGHHLEMTVYGLALGLWQGSTHHSRT